VHKEKKHGGELKGRFLLHGWEAGEIDPPAILKKIVGFTSPEGYRRSLKEVTVNWGHNIPLNRAPLRVEKIRERYPNQKLKIN